MACLSVVIQALCLQPNLLHNWCFTSLEKLPGIGSLPGFRVLPVMHIGRVQEDIGLRVWHIKFWQMAVAIPSDWLVSCTTFHVMTVLWLGARLVNKTADACVATLPFADILMTAQFAPGMTKHLVVSLPSLMR